MTQTNLMEVILQLRACFPRYVKLMAQIIITDKKDEHVKYSQPFVFLLLRTICSVP